MAQTRSSNSRGNVVFSVGASAKKTRDGTFNTEIKRRKDLGQPQPQKARGVLVESRPTSSLEQHEEAPSIYSWSLPRSRQHALFMLEDALSPILPHVPVSIVITRDRMHEHSQSLRNSSAGPDGWP